MSHGYFTDREQGPRVRSVGVIDSRVWGGLYALITARLNDESFGYRFPDSCPDGYGMCGCDRQAYGLSLAAEVPEAPYPLSPHETPPVPVVMDLLEFCASAVGAPARGDWHSYFRHHHLAWDRGAGLQRFVDDVNALFARNGIAFELTPEGHAMRLLPPELDSVLRGATFRTGDAEADRLLEAARLGIASPHLNRRRDALEKLWDAFERLKTLGPGADKREQIALLLDRAASGAERFRGVLEDEARALTAIGNSFRIRHAEAGQEILTSQDHLDYLFGRMVAFIVLLLTATTLPA